MAPRLDPRDPDGVRLRKAIGTTLSRTADALEAADGDRHTAIHEARKTFKRLRALYRLMDEAGPEALEREGARLRAAARLLAASREPAALAETGRWLEESARNAEENARFARLATTLEARRDAMAGENIDAAATSAAALCREAARTAPDLPWPNGSGRTAKLLARGWRRLMIEGRRTLSPMTVDSEADVFHDLRKRAQTMSACHSLLKPLWPEAMRIRQESYRDLIDNLGRDNDLDELVTLMEREPQRFGEAIEQVILQRLIARRRQALRLLSLQQAASVFGPDPKDDARRIRLLWEALTN